MMELDITSFVKELLGNSVFFWALFACGFAQVSKLFITLLLEKEFRLKVLVETGGMPSSHSALVTGTASGIGLFKGFDDPTFALAATFAFIVMYDASGIRKAAGETAERINKLPAENWPMALTFPLKETLGHTRLEVFIGSLLGPLIVIPGICLIGSPLNIIKGLGLF